MKNMEILESIERCGNIIEAVRYCDTGDKTFISRVGKVSWTTVNNSLKLLSEDKLIKYKNDKYSVKEDAAFFLGIAFGAQETKVSIVDFAFNPIDSTNAEKYGLTALFKKLRDNLTTYNLTENENILCFRTGDDTDSISFLCNSIIRVTIDFFSKNQSCLLGIGMTFPGIIDNETLEMRFCPNIPCLNNVYLLDLINASNMELIRDEKISFFIGHDTVAITVYEKERLYFPDARENGYMNKKNVVCLYLGYGLGSGIIVNNQLLIGASNSAGEIGHLPCTKIEVTAIGKNELEDMGKYVYEKNRIEIRQENVNAENVPTCYCSINNCIENIFRIDVFNSADSLDYAEKTRKDLLLSFCADHPYRYKMFKKYIIKLLNIVINIINPDIVILCGRIFNGIPDLKNEINILKQGCNMKHAASKCNIIFGSERPDAVAVGAAIMSYKRIMLREANDLDDHSETKSVSWWEIR